MVLQLPVRAAHAVLNAIARLPDVNQVRAQHPRVPVLTLVAAAAPAKRLPHLQGEREVERLLDHKATSHVPPSSPRRSEASEP